MRAAAAAMLAGTLAAGCASDASGGGARFAVASPREARAILATAPPAVPPWARVFARTLPATTAHQLNLDHLHRRRNPLGVATAARIRRAVADANRCAAGRAIAEADLAAAPPGPAGGGGRPRAAGSDDPDRDLLDFARRLTLEASAITDEEVAALLAAHGPEDVVALVHAVAHANFQDRILLALGDRLDGDAVVPPVEVRPPAPEEAVARPRRAAPGARGGADAEAAPPETVPWSDVSRDRIRGLLERQRSRAARIPAPDATRMARMPRAARHRTRRTAWGAMTMPYQPEMTAAWFRTMDAFDREADLDDVLRHSVFWVVTRTSECFY